jgi:hypothetical protein
VSYPFVHSIHTEWLYPAVFIYEAVRTQVEGSKVMSLDPEKLPPQLPESEIVQLLIAHAESEFEKNASHVVKDADGVTAAAAAPRE